MKRLRAEDAGKEASGPPLSTSLYRQPITNTARTIAYSGSGPVKVVGEGMQSSIYPPVPPVSYGAMPSAAPPHAGKQPQAIQPLSVVGGGGAGGPHSQMRSKGASPPTAPPVSQQQSPGSSFQRLKVEDALSYLDLVKYKFGDKPQVYNDFLDIMKEFKSQSIDTPGVITRVSNLFKGFPDLIVGFNTFLPPGYKIEVQKSEQGYAFHVSLSVPSPTGTSMPDPQQQKPAMILSGHGTIIHSSNAPPPGLNQQQQPPQQQQQHALPAAAAPAVAPHQSHQALPVASVLTQAPTSASSLLHHNSTYGSSTSQHNNSVHNTLTLSATQAAVTQALQGHNDTPQNQPVEFNHAINYVNKIKNRFQGQPEKYKRFLEILHTYQKEQRTLKEAQGGTGGKHLTEQEVYSQVAKLFENQSDLLAEFGQFLPDATSHITPPPLSEHLSSIGGGVKKQPTNKPYRDHLLDRHVSHKPGHISSQVKRSPPYPSLMHRDAPPPKKHKLSPSCRDVTLAEAGKFGSLNDYAFFDKVRKAVRSQEVYNNFLRCLTLFNQEIVSKSELVQLATPFIGKYPELMRWFRDFLGQGEVEPIPYNVTRVERPQGEHASDIDYTTQKRLGASYCVIPPNQEGLRFSGRTQLCHEVLNNQWVSFPTWSEDSSFVGSRKNQYEEYMYRCEDERFELDVVIETNAATIRVLEGVQKKINRMSPDEISRYRLDECLGGTSSVLHQRALKRIYGEKAPDIIDGLKRNPAVAVPVVLRRLKTKEEEWREAQKGFNKIWREQNEKFYLKSLDYQGINFKQNDVKMLRSKSLFNEIESLFEERNEQNEERTTSDPIIGPHMAFPYRDKTILDDAANLLIHHVKRQTGVQKGEKRRIKHILRQFVPDLFFHPRQQLSDDEREDDDDKEDGNESPSYANSNNSDSKASKGNTSPGKSPARASEPDSDKMEVDIKEEDVKVPLHAICTDPEEAYTLFMASNNWYLFLRLHAILCERLAKIYERAIIIADDESKNRTARKESTAVALRLKPKPTIEVDEYYPAFLDMVKNLLDGNMEATAYEDTLREMFGIHAFIAFTLDKVVSYAVRQLQHCVTERTAISCMEMFQKEQKKCGAGGLCISAHRRLHHELAYERSVEKIVQEENCYKIYIYKRDCRMTIEMIDTESEEPKKAEDTKKWSSYRDRYQDHAGSDMKIALPLYLNRTLRKWNMKNNRRNSVNMNKEKNELGEGKDDKRLDDKRLEEGKCDGELNSLAELERKLNERAPAERNQTNHPGYEVADDAQCRFNPSDWKMLFMTNKDSFLYKRSALFRAKETHPSVTKRKNLKFRTWLKRWATVNVSDNQHKQCTDWLMGRCDNVIPNRTRVIPQTDLSRTPYVPYNRYHVEILKENST